MCFLIFNIIIQIIIYITNNKNLDYSILNTCQIRKNVKCLTKKKKIWFTNLFAFNVNVRCVCVYTGVLVTLWFVRSFCSCSCITNVPLIWDSSVSFSFKTSSYIKTKNYIRNISKTKYSNTYIIYIYLKKRGKVLSGHWFFLFRL